MHPLYQRADRLSGEVIGADDHGWSKKIAPTKTHEKTRKSSGTGIFLFSNLSCVSWADQQSETPKAFVPPRAGRPT